MGVAFPLNPAISPRESGRDRLQSSSRFMILPKNLLFRWIPALWLLLWLPAARADWIAYWDYGSRVAGVSNVLNWGQNVGSGYLTNQATGQRLNAFLALTTAGNPDMGIGVQPLVAGTPAYGIFNGYCTLDGVCAGYLNSSSMSSSVTISGLSPAARYTIIGTVHRDNPSYIGRITRVELLGADTCTPAHTAGIITTGLASNEAALVCYNPAGEYVSWRNIPAGADGTIELRSSMHAMEIAYGISAIRLQEEALPTTIVSQPQRVALCQADGSATFTVVVDGAGPFLYLWHRVQDAQTNLVTSVVSDALSNTLILPTPAQEGSYFVLVSNWVNQVTSGPVALTIGPSPIEITSQPADLTVPLGGTAAFTLAESPAGSRPVGVQWFSGLISNAPASTLIPGATNYVLMVSNVSPNSATYYCAVLSNCAGQFTSRLAALTVSYEPIQITRDPQSVTNYLGSTAFLSVQAAGSLPQYQWYKDGQPLEGRTNNTISFANVHYTNGGDFYVVVSNPDSAKTSQVATLSVVTRPPITLFTLSGRDKVWKYNQDGVNLGPEWYATNYDDSTWATGNGVLAVENAPAVIPYINTTLSLIAPTKTNQTTTYYFRTTFNLSPALDRSSLVLVSTNIFDDGMIVYLNGTRVYSYNMPATDVTYDTWATASVPVAPASEGDLYLTNLPSALLLPGANYLAVEVHQFNSTSSDIVMGLGLQAVFPPPRPLSITRQPQSLVGDETTSVGFSVGWTGFPASFQWYQATNSGPTLVSWPIPGARGESYTIAAPLQDQDNGWYYVVVTNVLNTLTSSLAQLTVVPHTRAPALVDADGTGDARQILLSFDEVLWDDAAYPEFSPRNPSNFSVTNTFGEVLTVTNAIFSRGTNVLLETSQPRQPGCNYIATVNNGVMDTSPRHNLAVGLAAPVATLVTAVAMVDAYWFAQPIAPYDPLDDFASGAWKSPAYDPAGSGSAWFYPGWSVFYQGNGNTSSWPNGTALSPGATAYFLRPLELPASPAGARLRLWHFVDGGAAFYFNGMEVARFNLHAGPLTPNTPAQAEVTQAALLGPIEIPSAWLTATQNVLAAELHSVPTPIHQAFAMQLDARVDSLVTGPAVITTPPRNLTVAEGEMATLSFLGAGGASFQWRSNGLEIAGATDPVYVIPWTPRSADGARYTVVVNGQTNSVESRPAVLTVLPDAQAPVLLGAYWDPAATDTILASFSEPLSPVSGTNPANYNLFNALGAQAHIVQITLTNGTNALIKLAALPPSAYTLVVDQVRDASSQGNKIASNSLVSVGLRDYPLAVIHSNDVWRYNDSGTDLGTAWRVPGYDDTGAGWENGGSLFDAKPGGRAPATLPYPVATGLAGCDRANNIPTYYFRKAVTVPVVGANMTLTIATVVDDGAAFYINGNLFYSLGVTPNSAYGAWATRTVGDAAFEGSTTIAVTTNIVAGTNLLAAEAKNVNAYSADVTFGAIVTLNVPSQVFTPLGPTNAPPPVSPTLVISREGDDVVLSWTEQEVFTLENTASVSPPAPAWQPVTNQTNPYRVSITNASTFYRLRR
jgi:hypothetical protein